jgi:proliferating cell nuclear antigen
MTIIFSASTIEAHRIKILTEMLCHTLKLAHFEINDSGIFLRTVDNEDTLLIDLALYRENFKKYKCEKTMYIGINVIHLFKMLKCTKKKDSITLFIDSDRPTDLAIRIEQFDQINKTTSYVKIQNVQNVDPGVLTGYKHPVIIPSSNFQKLVKGLNHIYDQVDITSVDGWIRFLCDAGEVYSREVEFGETNDIDQKTIQEVSDRIKETDQVPEGWYHHKFHTHQLVQLIRISGLCTNIQVYVNNDLPLKFKLKVGSLGDLSIYIKSIGQVEAEEAEKNNRIPVDEFDSDSECSD